MTELYKSSLDSIETGDPVILDTGNTYGHMYALATVTRTTKTQIIIDKKRFLRLSGKEIDTSYRNPTCIHAPNALLETWRRSGNETWLDRYNAWKATYDAAMAKAPYIRFLAELERSSLSLLDLTVLKSAAESLGFAEAV